MQTLDEINLNTYQKFSLTCLCSQSIIKITKWHQKARERNVTEVCGYKKHHCQGQRYHYQQVPGAGRAYNPVHTFCGHPSYIAAAYTQSKLLPDGATLVQEIFVNPGIFIMLCLGREVGYEENRIDDDTFDLTDTTEENASSTAGSRLSHKMVEKLKDMIKFPFIHVFNCPPEEEWGG